MGPRPAPGPGPPVKQRVRPAPPTSPPYSSTAARMATGCNLPRVARKPWRHRTARRRPPRWSSVLTRTWPRSRRRPTCRGPWQRPPRSRRAPPTSLPLPRRRPIRMRPRRARPPPRRFSTSCCSGSPGPMAMASRSMRCCASWQRCWRATWSRQARTMSVWRPSRSQARSNVTPGWTCCLPTMRSSGRAARMGIHPRCSRRRCRLTLRPSSLRPSAPTSSISWFRAEPSWPNWMSGWATRPRRISARVSRFWTVRRSPRSCWRCRQRPAR